MIVMVETAVQIRKMSRELGIEALAAVINRAGGQDIGAISTRLDELGIPVIGVVPYGGRLVQADMSGQAPFDAGGDAVSAIRG